MPRSPLAPRRALPFATALGVLAAAPLPAADWEVSPRIQAGYQYDDNYRLAPDGAEIEVSGALADVQLQLKRATPVFDFTFTPRVRATYFPDEREEDSEDYFGLLELVRRGQRVEAALRTEFADEDVVSSEQPGTDIDTGLGEPGVVEGGILVVRNRRQLISVRPSLSHELSQRHSLLYNLRYVDVEFDEQVPGLQVGYTDAEAAFGWAYAVSERSTLTSRVRGTRYELDTGQRSSDGYGVEFEWGSEATQTIRSFLRVGAQRTDVVRVLGDSVTETSWLAGAGLRWTAGLTQLFGDATRSVGPTSSGVIVERDQLRLRLDRAVTPRFSFFTGLRGVRDSAVDSASGFRDRKYATAEIGAQWRILQQLSLTAAVDYAWQEFRAQDDASSSGAMITLVYEPRRRD